MNYLFLIILALAPSFIWLSIFLREDSHPESKRMVLKIFYYGMLAALPAALIELGFFQLAAKLNLPSIFIWTINIFLGVALVEETLKYLVVKEKVLNDPEFDEPLDAMLYMIIAALGFAALENLLIFFFWKEPLQLSQALSLAGLRFIGATFLHALCSGVLGYFLALSLWKTKSRSRLLIIGLVISVTLHGLYNFSIMEIGGLTKFVIPFIILSSLALFVLFGFSQLKKIASVCDTPADKGE